MCYVHGNVNIDQNVNAAAGATERALLAKLQEILSSFAWEMDLEAAPSDRSHARFDARVTLHPRTGKPVVFLVDVKRDLRPALFQAWEAKYSEVARSRRATPVLGLPSVSPRIAELCRDAGWSWFDLAGNCWIDVPGLLHVERTGREPVRPVRRAAANLSSAAAGRVLRVLLSPGHAHRSWTQRDLQAHTCWRAAANDQPVSLGLVNKLLRHLRNEGYVESATHGGVRVRDYRGLLTAWRTAYAFDRHERRSYFTLLKGAQLAEALHLVGLAAGGRAAYAAFSAADRHLLLPRTRCRRDRRARPRVARAQGRRPCRRRDRALAGEVRQRGVLRTTAGGDVLRRDDAGGARAARPTGVRAGRAVPRSQRL